MNQKIVKIILDKKVNLKNFILVEGFPGIGLVGTIAAGYIIEKRKMEPIGHIESYLFPPMAAIHQGKPYFPARIYKDKKSDFCILLSEFIMPASVVHNLADAILEFAEKQKIKQIVSLAGMSSTSETKEKIFGIASNDEMFTYLKSKKIPLINEGITTGVSGILIAKCAVKNFPALSLLVKSSTEYPDPRASAYLIQKLSDLIGLEVDTKELLKEADKIEAKLKGMMKNIQQMKAYKKAEEGELPMYG